MVSREAVLFTLKRSLLEYSLRHHIDSVVANFALDKRSKFSNYQIPSIRFELYNLYKTVKDQHSQRYNGLIEFLTEFNEHFPTIIPEKLYLRVLTSLKALYIYECLRSNDIKKTARLIKDYFPPDEALEASNENKENENASSKSNFELKILKLRMQWNELILNKAKRNLFFEKQFHVQYDHEFLKFLFNKTLVIIEHINSYLPESQIDQVFGKNFKGICKVLFDQDYVEMELEDEVRFQLYVDHLKLHQLEIINSKSAARQSDRVQEVTPASSHRYLKKLFKLFTQWRQELDETDANCGDTCIAETCSQQMTEGAASIIHEILYLDSQFDQCQLQSHHDQTNNEIEMTEEDQANHEQNGSSLITNDTTSSKGQQSSLTDVTRLRMSMTDTSGDLNGKSMNAAVTESPGRNGGPVTSDLITDDERDTNTSY